MTLLLIFSFFTFCTKTINSPKYYVLEFDVEQVQNADVLVKEVCEIFPVRVSEVYAQHRMAIRKRSHEINYYHYHKWAESPDVNLERLIQKKLDAEGLFLKVSNDLWNVTPRYQLYSTVNYLEAVEGEDDLFAHISMSFEIFDKEKREVILTHTFDESQPLEDWDLNLMSMAMSTILQNELSSFSNKIKNYFINVHE